MGYRAVGLKAIVCVKCPVKTISFDKKSLHCVTFWPSGVFFKDVAESGEPNAKA
ncbi:hypothetical protein Xsto_02934 [Xenorhabdus stockiae]|uniref:Uncharacterized protein n=1 Tax=Xenorhabdus stockiae TaxID=351614 RepID=A0A2D0KMB3_9GAMM|nr:hypothetical protein Xsto_02934 [Xenorhabdus stockiae]PHM69220.1 hypothetical protein Xekj_02737 [Xenorhabdus sp. KJ12.1]